MRAFETGVYREPGQFNSTHEALFAEYFESVKAFNKWDEFYRACDFSQNNTRSLSNHRSSLADMSQIDIGRRALNFSSSPVKELP